MNSSHDESKCNDSTGGQHSELQSDPSKTYFLLPSSKEAEAQKVVQLLSGGDATAGGQCAIRIQFENSNESSEIVNSSSDLNKSTSSSPVHSLSSKTESTVESWCNNMSPSTSASDCSFSKLDDHSKIGLSEGGRRHSPRKVRCPTEWSDQTSPKRPKNSELGESPKPNGKPIVETKSTNKSMKKSMNKSVNNEVWDRIAYGLNDATFWDPIRPDDDAQAGDDPSSKPQTVGRPKGGFGFANYRPISKSSLLMNDKSRLRTKSAIPKSKSTGDIISNAVKQQSAHQKLNSSFEPSSSAGVLGFICKVLKSRSSSDHNQSNSSSEQSAGQIRPPSNAVNETDNADKAFREPTELEIYEILDSEASLDRETKGRIFDKMNLLIKSKLEKAMNQFVEQMISAKNDILNSSLSASEESSEPATTENATSPERDSPGNGQPASSSQKENSPESPTSIQARKSTAPGDRSKVRNRASPTKLRMRVVPAPRVIHCYEIEKLRNGNSVVRDSKTQRVIRVIKADDPAK